MVQQEALDEPDLERQLTSRDSEMQPQPAALQSQLSNLCRTAAAANAQHSEMDCGPWAGRVGMAVQDQVTDVTAEEWPVQGRLVWGRAGLAY